MSFFFLVISRFNLCLPLGANSFLVEATIHENNTVDLKGAPQTSNCGVSSKSIPSISVGYVMAPMNIGDNTLLFYPLDPSNTYLPSIGPYTVTVDYIFGTIGVEVVSASCPR